MKERILPAVQDVTRGHAEQIERAILKVLQRDVYVPLLKLLGLRTLRNSERSLLQDISDGQIKYDGEGFVGLFSAETSKTLQELGAKWIRDRWEIPLTHLPTSARDAMRFALRREEAIKERLLIKLDEIRPDEIVRLLDTTQVMKRAVDATNAAFKANIKNITVAPELSDQARDKVAADYTNNIALAVKDFTEAQIAQLRAAVADSVFLGRRADQLAKMIQANYNVSARKAKFIARQETALLSAKVTEARYQDAGIDEYEWRCATGTAVHPVRHMHRVLDGTRQKFSAPPVASTTGKHYNPGEDFNCRCTARPIVKF